MSIEKREEEMMKLKATRASQKKSIMSCYPSVKTQKLRYASRSGAIIAPSNGHTGRSSWRRNGDDRGVDRDAAMTIVICLFIPSSGDAGSGPLAIATEWSSFGQ